eukprot:TRINITY_DN56193_c0_g1_i1.p1 TRINITY_DN56193_c0_g1~~TRINITY_DN56193_c0_g1_i1.p1  ORF type:complete len:248 (+),score=20.67 TRINITY_DN56193_c0_g1_i1:53-796(+)
MVASGRTGACLRSPRLVLRRWTVELPRWHATTAKVDGSMRRALAWPRRHPFATNVVLAAAKACLADLIVQFSEGGSKLDARRNAVFSCFGCAHGILQWFLYVRLFSYLFPNAVRFANLSWAEKLKDRAGQRDLLKQIALDNFGHNTFLYFPLFYTVKEAIQGTALEDQSPMDIARSARQKYLQNCVSDNLSVWAVWFPGDIVVYSVPMWLRMPSSHAISLAWTMLLSVMRGGEPQHDHQTTGCAGPL